MPVSAQPAPGVATLVSAVAAHDRAASFDPLVDAIRGGDVVVLSGAGPSTESGIPDYRGPAGVQRNHQPMTDRVTVTAVHPDGDVPLPDADIAGFVVPDCERCSGVLKPDVVCFGECVPRDRVDRSFAMVDTASLLVLSFSLAVMSGYRFVLRAAQRGIPVAIINAGETRGNARATYRLDAQLGPTLTKLAARVAADG